MNIQLTCLCSQFVVYDVILFTHIRFIIRTGMVIIKKENENKIIRKMSSNNGGSCLDKILADVSKQSATKQILIGAASGWYLFIEIYRNFLQTINIKIFHCV